VGETVNEQEKKTKAREYQRQWREKHKGYHAAYQARRKAEWFAQNGPCRKCGGWENLEVDHIDPSTKITHNIWCWPLERRLAELAKCQVLCESCHLEKTKQDLRSINRNFALQGRHVLRPDMVRFIRAWSSAGMGHRGIAAILNIHHATVYSVLVGKSWAWLDREGGA